MSLRQFGRDRTNYFVHRHTAFNDASLANVSLIHFNGRYVYAAAPCNVFNVAWRIESLIANNNQSFKTGRLANFYLCQLHGC